MPQFIIAVLLFAGSGADPLRSWLRQIAAGQLEARKAAVARIHSPEQFEQRRAEVRKKILHLVGGLPRERTPLNPRRTGRLDRGDYRVEKIIFESQPGFFVTANLYVPQAGRPPYPAVLHATGHSLSAKARAFYQTLSLGLVKHGFVVLTYDPLGQGERRIFWDRDLQDSKIGGSTVEHMMVGVQSLLAGESLARAMIWDGVRALDLLESLPEVDPKRLGVTGCSGGGTLTAQLAALDDRLRAAAPACYISSWEDQLDGTGPQDAEQQFPGQLKEGLDHADFVTAFAPKPYLICSTRDDYFPLEGARKAYEEGRRIWGLFGAQERIAWEVGPGGHGMPVNVREAIYGWMSRWLKAQPGPAPEPRFQTEYEEDLLCTATGQVSTSLGGLTASDLNLRRYANLQPARPIPNLRERVLRVTRYQPFQGPESLSRERLIRPDPARDRRKSILFVSDRGASDPDAQALAELGYTVLALDVSGRGETASRWGGYAEAWFGQDKIAWLALMVGRPLVGLRMDDILRGVDLLRQRNLLYDGVCHGFGSGLSSVDLLHAAAIDGRISALSLEGMLISYRAVAQAPIHRRIFDAVLPGVLTEYDLPDLAAGLAPRPVRMVNARTPAGGPALLRAVREAYAFPHVAAGVRREEEGVAEAYPELR